jgi:ADP-heptose:LPS heptosyltransferase
MHILAVRIGRVGDTVMMTPALTALLQCYPHAKLTILASPEGKVLLRGFHPNVHQIWTWDRHGLIKAYNDKRKLLLKIVSSRFDRIYCFYTSKHIARLFEHVDSEFYWFHNPSEKKHTARHYLDLVASTCEIDVDHIYNTLPVDDAASKQVDKELAAAGIEPDDIVVMIHPTYSGYSRWGLRKREARIRKLWPAHFYGELGKRLSITQINGKTLKPLIDLLPREMSLGQKIVQYSDETITLLHPQINFNRYKALIARANLLLSPDSGPMHIASAVGTRIVAFFSKREPTDCGPYMDPALFTILQSDDPVRGISTIGVEAVYDAIISQLAADTSTQ